MITLDIQKYCHDCPDFEAEVQKSATINQEIIMAFDTKVSCKHKKRCHEIKKYLERK